MSSRKRTADSAVTTSSKKRKVTITTFNKWKAQFERDYNMLSWLRCDAAKEDKTVVEMLWCKAYRKHEDKITSMKNFSKAWITGSSNQKTSNIVDHTMSEQHRAAMVQVRPDVARASNQLLTTYSPIARSLTVMDEAVQGRMKRKFDICYVMAKVFVSSLLCMSSKSVMVLILALPTRPMFQPRPSPITSPRVSVKASLKGFPLQTSTVSSWMVPLTQATWKMSWCWSSTVPKMLLHKR
jgi:hypothetical protein